MTRKKYVFAITGASAPLFGIRLLEYLARDAELHMTISAQAFSIIRQETGIDWTGETDAEIEGKIRTHLGSGNIYFHDNQNLAAPISSGSFLTDGMFVVPCSMKSLSGIANGYANSLTERAADVTIKEGRRLLISPREMPFSAIHLENMLKLARLGVTIAPPLPAFYQKPEGMKDLVDFVAGKMLDCFNIEHTLFKRWK